MTNNPMTKEQFFDEMLKWVNFYKEKLEPAELRRAMLPKELRSGRESITYNPFLEFDERYFNIRTLSNLQGLKSVIDNNPELLPHQINLLIIGNSKFKVLNQMLNSNMYLVNELKENIHSPMDIAIAYARHCMQEEKFRNMPKR